MLTFAVSYIVELFLSCYNKIEIGFGVRDGREVHLRIVLLLFFWSLTYFLPK